MSSLQKTIEHLKHISEQNAIEVDKMTPDGVVTTIAMLSGGKSAPVELRNLCQSIGANELMRLLLERAERDGITGII